MCAGQESGRTCAMRTVVSFSNLPDKYSQMTPQLKAPHCCRQYDAPPNPLCGHSAAHRRAWSTCASPQQLGLECAREHQSAASGSRERGYVCIFGCILVRARACATGTHKKAIADVTVPVLSMHVVPKQRHGRRQRCRHNYARILHLF